METTKKRLIYNAIRTPDGTILVSRHVHDYVSYTDKNGQFYAVDGGLSYAKRAYDEDDYEDISLYDDSPFWLIREHLAWGTYGKDGKQPLTWKPLKKLDTDHIQVLIDDGLGSDWFKEFLKKELEYRNKEIIKNP